MGSITVKSVLAKLAFLLLIVGLVTATNMVPNLEDTKISENETSAESS